MTSQKSVEQGPDGLALVVVQEPGGLEGQPEALVVSQPIVFAKDQEICRGRKRNGQLGNDTERRLIGPEFVAPELAEMDSGPFGQRSLGHAPLASQGGQSLGELHGPHAIKLGIVDTTYIGYNQLDTVLPDERPNESGGPMGSSMKTRAVPDDVVPFDVDAADHQAVLSGVLDHYAEHLSLHLRRSLDWPGSRARRVRQSDCASAMRIARSGCVCRIASGEPVGFCAPH